MTACFEMCFSEAVRKLFDAVFLAEFLNTASCVDNFLFASVKRMAFRADFNMQRLNHCGLSHKLIATAAGNFNFIVIWVNVCFHDACVL